MGCEQSKDEDTIDDKAVKVERQKLHADGGYVSVDIKVVEEAVETGNYIIIDVREPEEVAETGIIPNAHLIPVHEVVTAFKLSYSEFEAKYSFVKPEKDAHNIVLYCKSGARATQACSELTSIGYTRNMIYTGSWSEWSVKNPEMIEMYNNH